MRGRINERDDFPELKCCRQIYGVTGTSFCIEDKMYADTVLTIVFSKYNAPEGLKEYLLQIFDDWSGFDADGRLKNSLQPPTVQSLKFTVGKGLDQEPKFSLRAFFGRIFFKRSCRERKCANAVDVVLNDS